MTSSSNSSQSTRPIGRVLWKELLVLSRFYSNYELTSGFLVPCPNPVCEKFFLCSNSWLIWPYVLSRLQIRVRIGKLFSLLLIKKICYGYLKVPSQTYV